MHRIYKDTIQTAGNEKGIALVSALILSVIGMLLIASLLFLIDTGTLLSGSKKRYQMALSAAHGGMILFTKETITRGLGGTNLSAMGDYDGVFTPAISNADFNTKLNTTGYIGDGGYPGDTVDATVSLAFPSSINMAVTTAIVSTARGNSATSSNVLLGGGVVNNSSGNITPQHIPYLYQVETQGQKATNPKENAGLSTIYVY